MKIDKRTIVIHKQTGLEYVIDPRPDYGENSYYLAANDGRVPSGQMIYFTTEEINGTFSIKA